MNNIELVKNELSKRTGRLGLILQKHAPEIMLVAGVGGIVVGTILACKATLKVEQVIQESKDELEKIKTFQPTADQDYTEDDRQKDVAISYVRSGTRFIKLYGPSFSLYLGGLICILGAHGIMKKRQVALVAAYNVVSESFNLYRKRVMEKYGESEEYSLRHGTVEETVEYVDQETGKKKKTKVQVTNDNTKPSEYARFFDESSRYYEKDATLNRFFLSTKQNYLNDKLKVYGHLFLNEVYDELGLPRSQAGAIVGWLNGEGDSFVDFGMYRMGNENFINGYERSVLLDFNVDGVIFDKI